MARLLAETSDRLKNKKNHLTNATLCGILKLMNNRTETLLNNHIIRIQQDILERDQTTFSDGKRCNPFHEQLDEVDLKNIASLREGRIPKYGDHMEMDNEIDMSEFSDLTAEKRQEAVGLYAGTEPSLV